MDKREDTGNYYPGGTVVTGTPVPTPGGGSSVEVVAPSPDGAGKAADAKAVYEGLERKQNKLEGNKLAALDLIDEVFVTQVTHLLEFVPTDLHSPILQITSALRLFQQFYNDIKVQPTTNSVLLPFCYNTIDFATSPGVTSFTIAGVDDYRPGYGIEAEYLRDLVMIIDCTSFETAPNVTWAKNFHPRTDAETDFACVAGVRNVYWITEYASGEFVVAWWQETKGGNAQ